MAALSVQESGSLPELARKFVKESLGNRVVTGAAGVLASRAAFNGLSFVLNVILARMLGALGLGVYTYALAWIFLLMVPCDAGNGSTGGARDRGLKRASRVGTVEESFAQIH